MTTYRDILRNINEAVEKMNEKSGKILDIYYIDSFNKFNYVYMVDHDNDDLLFYGDEITKQQFDKTMKMAKNVKDVVKVNLIDLSGKSGKERDVIFNKYKNKINGKSSFVNKQFFSNESINEEIDKPQIMIFKGYDVDKEDATLADLEKVQWKKVKKIHIDNNTKTLKIFI